MSSEPIGLATALHALRSELAQAMAEGEGQPVRLQVESVNLELSVQVTNSREAEGGARFWVVSGSGRAGQDTTTTHTLSLQLTAQTPAGKRALAGGPRLPVDN
mgnify:CR=1 FL=1